MTAPEYTRRSALALFAGVTLAGCSVLSEGRYWDSPPEFDASGLDSVTERSVPERPDSVPVDVDADQRSAFDDRVTDLLDPIPEPLTAEIVPNGEIRQKIESRRTSARESRDRIASASDTLSTIEAAADAGEDAGAAAGIWAVITTSGSPDDVRPHTPSVSERARRRRDAVPDVATGPAEGAVVYGVIEEWIQGALPTVRRNYRNEENPLRMGRSIGETERIRTEVEAGAYVHDAYVDSLDRSRQVGEPLSAAAADLAPRLKERIDGLGESDDEHPLHPPNVETLVNREYRRDEPAIRLLSRTLHDSFEDIRYRPIAWPEYDTDYPGMTVRNTFWALASVEAIEELVARIDDGDDLFPEDAEAVRNARETAIKAIEGVVEESSPLGVWAAWRLVPRFEEPDAALASMTDVGRRRVARAYGEYVRLATMGRAIPDAERTVSETF